MILLQALHGADEAAAPLVGDGTLAELLLERSEQIALDALGPSYMKLAAETLPSCPVMRETIMDKTFSKRGLGP